MDGLSVQSPVCYSSTTVFSPSIHKFSITCWTVVLLVVTYRTLYRKTIHKISSSLSSHCKTSFQKLNSLLPKMEQFYPAGNRKLMNRRGEDGCGTVTESAFHVRYKGSPLQAQSLDLRHIWCFIYASSMHRLDILFIPCLNFFFLNCVNG